MSAAEDWPTPAEPGSLEARAAVERLHVERAAEAVCGWKLLGDVETFLARYIVYPGEAERIAHVLWIAHTWFMDAWESTPRVAFLSPEPGSGKSRALEVTEPLVPRAVHAVNATPAYLFRKVSDPAGPPTILFDEIDTVFGPKAKDNEELRGLLNAGHRKGAMAGRCVIRGKEVFTEELPAYAAVALAGLDDLPDTIMTRSVVVRMRRRAPGEHVEPWRRRTGEAQAEGLRRDLDEWSSVNQDVVAATWPTMPAGVEDRAADVWEALLAVADLAGGDWPDRARQAAVTMVKRSQDRAPSLGVLLLGDLRATFAEAGADRMATEDILARLVELDESPWGDLRGKPLDARGLSRRLAKYGVAPKDLRIGARVLKGYEAGDLADAWTRYLPARDEGCSAVADVADKNDHGRGTDVPSYEDSQIPPPGIETGASRTPGPRPLADSSATSATALHESDPDVVAPRPYLEYARTRPGRCGTCGWHVATQGHAAGCPDREAGATP